MCNLYAMMRSRSEVGRLARAIRDLNHNQPPQPGIYPDYAAPVVVKDAQGEREVRDLRWGMPSSSQALFKAASARADKLRAKGKVIDDAGFRELLRLEPDGGTTNVRNTASRHWTRWLGPANRCLVPMTSFCEPDQVGGSKQNIWFALGDDRPLAFFAGVWTPWTSVRKIKEGEVTCDLYGFLTTDANADVARHHDKAMPVILTEAEAWDLWLSDAPWDEVKALQRPLPEGALRVVGVGGRKDEGAAGQY